MINSFIGSGDCSALLAGKNTKTHIDLLTKFVSGLKPYYNAVASPIDALRIGQILENKYESQRGVEWYSQYKAICKEMNVLKSSLDFAKLEKGKVIDFEEMKTVNFSDYLSFLSLDDEEKLNHVKKSYKSNYRQVQFQLLCTGLNQATLMFVPVYSYDDEENLNRTIKESEIIRINIKRDNEVIELIKERSKPFQELKDFYSK